jgi:hypothetical protein
VKLTISNALAVIAAGMLSACGGGGGQTQPLPLPSVAISGTSQSRTPVGNVKLTIKPSSNFHTVKRVKTSSSQRRPAYVNSNGFYIDVWVISSGAATHAVDSTLGSNTNNNLDGTSTFTIPIFTATGPSYIVAYETDQSFQNGGNLLAIGESDLQGFPPGSSTQASLTMLMATRSIGVMSDPNDANLDATTTLFPFTSLCCSSGVYFFAADAQGGFVGLAGVGGVSQPIVTSTSVSGVLVQNSGVNGGYTLSNNCSGPVNVNLTAGNPAYAIASDTFFNGQSFPGADFLYQNASLTDPSFQSYMSSAFFAGSTISTTIAINNNCP